METKIQSILKRLSFKLNFDSEFISKIDNSNDINELANIAIKLFDHLLVSKKMLLFGNDVKKLAELFGSFEQVNMIKRKKFYLTVNFFLERMRTVIMDGALRDEFSNKYLPSTLKILVSEEEFGELLSKFYREGMELFYPQDRESIRWRDYFFDDNADSIIYDDISKVRVGIISYVRNSSNNIILKEYIINNKGKLDYNEIQINDFLEKLLYDIENGIMVESYEKMYLDALKSGGVEAFLEIYEIRKRIDVKRLINIRNYLLSDSKERSDLNGLQNVSRPIVSKC